MNKNKLTVEEKKLIRQIQGDLPLCRTPYAPLAQQLGWEEQDLLKRVRSFIKRGLIRRLGAILRHQKAGYRGNAMVVWKVPEDRILRVSQAMAAFPAVSHCYLRPSQPKWPFNFYTMVHGQKQKDCRRVAKKISRETGLTDYQLLSSRREHKKSSMRYFE
ncbi:MAG: Lrp/AsnC family transcriptional regulator [Deltaproteobacteria bacterium]|nr:Lrp/AsnC family transcriptional regulator [Deltaproteobacteria bacterium]